MEIKKAKMSERSKSVDGSSKVEGMKCEGGDTVVWGANNAVPCTRACIVSSPVGEELAVCVSLLTEESKCMCVIIG